jgi:hypothetical protein
VAINGAGLLWRSRNTSPDLAVSLARPIHSAEFALQKHLPSTALPLNLPLQPSRLFLSFLFSLPLLLCSSLCLSISCFCSTCTPVLPVFFSLRPPHRPPSLRALFFPPSSFPRTISHNYRQTWLAWLVLCNDDCSLLTTTTNTTWRTGELPRGTRTL